MGYSIKEIKGNSQGMILKKVSINGNICGEYAEISINQVYENKSRGDVEGVYVFPIPKTAIISGFEAEVGGKTLKTIVEEKEKAFKIYENAKSRGDNTVFLEELKPHMFKIAIGKIISGETVKIKLSYIDELQYKDKKFKLTIPAMHEPTKMDEDSKLNNLRNTLVNKLVKKESEDSEFQFKTNIIVESLCKLEFESPYHKLKVEREGDTVAKINLQDDYEAMDKDFILIMKEKDPLEADGMIYEYKENGEDRRVVYLRMIPKLDDYEIEEKESYVFLIDISDTMKGDKIQQAKDALQICIRNLEEGDTFDIIAMGETLKYFWDEGMAQFNSDTLKKASQWIENLSTENDADIFGAIKYSLENEGGHNTILIFTDDEVEEEDEILDYVKENLGDNRIFTFGFDSETNNYFLNKLAHESFGKAEFINKGQRIEAVVLRQFKRIQNPEVDDVQIDWGNMQVQATYPRTIDYMYDREAFSIFAYVIGEVSDEIVVSGKVGDREYVKKVDLDNFNTEDNANLLKKVWARKRIRSIEMNMMSQRGDVKEAMRQKVIELSKNNGLISPETTFIFMELREEPVLGIELKNIIPISVKEITLSHEFEEENLDAADKSGFLYKKYEGTILEEKIHKLKGDNLYLNSKYPRNKLLRIIAKNQFAEGAFVDYEDSSTEDKVETTAMVLLAFILGDEDIDIYFNQLNKSVEFICDKCVSEDFKLEDRVGKMIILALDKAEEKGILKEKNMQKAGKTLDYLYDLLNKRESAKEMLNNLVEYSLKKNVASLFTVSEDGSCINEQIVISEERNSIFSMAKLAVLMILNDIV
ncbi:VWA domain-containing protein [Clostridium sp. P21]|uniref:VWA domain-containing protein n=1 Tax=Clostridium muellerianum TaxID=2716538 RepID=A0A7Y0EK71_9CLOT|nr:VIT and VWA domain-containing protein [Clostridium muellerianum]NMM64985.1 VWA domain-containing protein [Clostridium muellerianum]